MPRSCGATRENNCKYAHGWDNVTVPCEDCFTREKLAGTKPATPAAKPTAPAAVAAPTHTEDLTADELLIEVLAFIEQYVVIGSHELLAVALWTMHTHVFESSPTTPYLSVKSPEKQCGKTRTIETVALLVAKPLMTANISEAALFRAVSSLRPTLLFDEVDSIFRAANEKGRDDLRGILNAGYRRGGQAVRCGGRNMTELESFDVFCPKLLAGIGELPDTLRDRSIPIVLKRRAPGEQVSKFRSRTAEAAAEPVRDRLAAWAEGVADRLAVAEPPMPDELSDRATDCWEPLIAIADLAGADWGARARNAAKALSGRGADEDESRGVKLLTDIRTVFTGDAVSSHDLAAALNGLAESQWGGWNQGAGLTQRDLAKLLKPFEVQSKTVRIGKTTPRGFHREQFADAFQRYLPAPKKRSGLRNSEVLRLLRTYRPELVGADHITTPDERRKIAGLLALEERAGLLEAVAA
jgi:hypothetical protein